MDSLHCFLAGDMIPVIKPKNVSHVVAKDLPDHTVKEDASQQYSIALMLGSLHNISSSIELYLLQKTFLFLPGFLTLHPAERRTSATFRRSGRKDCLSSLACACMDT